MAELCNFVSRKAREKIPFVLKPPNDPTHTYVKPPCQNRSTMHPAELQALVDANTPDDKWYTPSTGWPQQDHAYANGPPPNIIPDATTVPDLHAYDGDVLGHLSLELLETTNLPKMDSIYGMQTTENDVYAFVLFERWTAKTVVIDNCDNPRWHVECARAMRFPITSPGSSIYIALLDKDTGTLLDTSDDDPIGRVIVPISKCVPDTVYDGWYQLQRRHVDPMHQNYGRIRVRYSVTWTSARRHVLSYLSSPPSVPLPLSYRQDRIAAAFALYGETPDKTFRWAVTRFYMRELSEMLGFFSSLYDGVDYLMRYEAPLTSLGALAVWQFVCLRPYFAPATLPLMLLCTLNHTYHKHHRYNEEHGVRKTPTFRRIFASLVLPSFFPFGRLRPLLADPLPRPLPSMATLAAKMGRRAAAAAEANVSPRSFRESFDAGDLGFADEDEEDDEHIFEQAVDKYMDATSRARKSKTFVERAEAVLSAMPDFDSLDWMDPRKLTLDSLDPSALARLGIKGLGTLDPRKIRLEDMKIPTEAMRDAINPANFNPIRLLHPYLSPLQMRLGSKLVLGRGIRSLFRWDDPYLTSLLYLGLVVSTGLMAVMPWRTIMQVTGGLMLGPHMLFFGWRTRRAERAERHAQEALVRAFAEADEKTREDIVMVEAARRRKLEADEKAAQDAVNAAAQAKADKARLKLPKELLARDKAIADLVEESYKCDADEPISLELTRLITECHIAELNLYTSRAFPLTAKASGQAKRD